MNNNFNKKIQDPMLFKKSFSEKKKFLNNKNKKIKIPKNKKNSFNKVKISESWFIRFLNFIGLILFRDSNNLASAFLEKRELKKQLKKLNYNFLDVNIQKIRTSFPEYIYEIYKELKKFSILFEEVLENDYKLINLKNRIFFMEYIESVLNLSEKQLIASMDEDYFRLIITEEDNPEKFFDKQLIELNNNIEKYNSQLINKYVSYFEKLLILSKFDFFNFFRFFDAQFIFDESYNVKFQPVFGEIAGKHLIRLNNYLRLINFNSISKKVLSSFDSILKNFLENIPKKNLTFFKINNNNKINKISDRFTSYNYSILNFSKLISLINLLNENNVLEIIIKLTTNDINYEPTVNFNLKSEGLFFKKYIKLMNLKFKQHFSEFYYKVQQELVKHEILKLLKLQSWEEVSGIVNYTTEISDKLKAKGMPGFSFVFPCIIYKSFYNRIYEQNIRKIIHSLLLKGKFFNKAEQRILTESLYNFDVIIERFNDLEWEFREAEMTVGEVIRYATSKNSDINSKMIMIRNLNKIEKRIESILVEGFKLYQIMSNYLNMACEDWLNSSKPRLLSNIKQIDDASSIPFHSRLSQAANLLNSFVELCSKLPNLKKCFKVYSKKL